jgi:hypothetical protein
MQDLVDWGIALVVGRPGSFGRAVMDTIEGTFHTVVNASSFHSAMTRLQLREPLAFVVVDLDCMEGAMFVAIEAARVAPAPVIFAVHREPLATNDAFLLGRSGIHQLLEAPLTKERLLAELEALATVELPQIPPLVSRFVGRVPMVEFLDHARIAFIDEAIDRAKENRSAAARMLGVHRQIVQRRLNDKRGRDAN